MLKSMDNILENSIKIEKITNVNIEGGVFID